MPGAYSPLIDTRVESSLNRLRVEIEEAVAQIQQ